MLEERIVFTYGELIDAFNTWDAIITKGSLPSKPNGRDAGEMFTNYLIETINKQRQDRLTSYDK